MFGKTSGSTSRRVILGNSIDSVQEHLRHTVNKLMYLIFAVTAFPFLAPSIVLRHQPESETLFLARRNPCDGLDYPQIAMYEDYTEPLCPAPKHLDHQGACDGFRDPQQDCSSFCQLTTTYVWARESPLFRSECHYPMRCEPRETDSTEWFVDGYISGNAQFQKAIDAGITGGIGSSSGRAIGHSWSVTPAPGECGYFTWVPVVKRTWWVETQCSCDTWIE
jgi:hypothetical protein